MLKSQSHLSLTVLKPSISTASSHRSSLSLGMIFGDVNIEGNTIASNKRNVVTTESADSLTSSIDGVSHMLPISITPLMTPSHVTRTSIMSDYEIKSALSELAEEQKRRERSPPFITPTNPRRVVDTSFGSSNIGVGGFPPSSRPRSTTSITNSVNSSGSGAGRYDNRISSPLNPTRSDPLALESLTRTTGQASITASETSVSSTSQQSRIRKANYSTGTSSGTPQSGRGHTSPYHPYHTWTGQPAKIPSDQSSINPNHSYGHEHSTSLIMTTRIPDFSSSDRYTMINGVSHPNTATSKQNSSRSVNDESTELADTVDADSTIEVSSLKRHRESARSSTVSMASSSRPSRKTGNSYSPTSSKRSTTLKEERRNSETKSNR